jgi:transcription antitermination factor NusA-like protein
MVNTINMQEMRYLNLFERIMGVRTRYCFMYNEALVFCVPKPLISKAVGENGRNIRKMSEILRKRIKVVAAPKGIEDAEDLIGAVVSPVTFRGIEIKDDEIVVSGGKNKAALIGRNKRRLLEMQKIVKGFFGRDFRIA